MPQSSVRENGETKRTTRTRVEQLEVRGAFCFAFLARRRADRVGGGACVCTAGGGLWRIFGKTGRARCGSRGGPGVASCPQKIPGALTKISGGANKKSKHDLLLPMLVSSKEYLRRRRFCSHRATLRAPLRSTPWGQLQRQKYLQAPSLRAWWGGVPPLLAGPVCTCGRASTDAVRTRAREKRKTKRTTDLQLLLPIARGAFCFAFLSRTWPCTIAVGGSWGGARFQVLHQKYLVVGKKASRTASRLGDFFMSLGQPKKQGRCVTPWTTFGHKILLYQTVMSLQSLS